MLRVGSIVVIIAGTALADAPKRDAKADATCKRELSAGRKAQGKKRYQDAIAAFERCLALAPDDATVLGELGWTAFLAKDLDRAEASTRKAIANHAEASVRASALYNLGLIAEAHNDTAAAIAAYADSLALRPNGTVRAALAKLDPKAPILDPFHPQPLAGPFEAIDAYCKSLPRSLKVQYGAVDYTATCTCGKPATKPGAKPYDEVALFDYTCQGTPPAHDDPVGDLTWHVATNVAGKWYVADLEVEHVHRNCFESDQHVALVDVAVRDAIAGGELEAIVRATTNGTCWHDNSVWDHAVTFVIGMGASHHPSAVRVVTRQHETTGPSEGEPTKTTNADVALTIDFAGGALVLAGTGLDKAETTTQLGKHPLVFP